MPNDLQAFKFTPYKAKQLRKFIPRARGQKLSFKNFKKELKKITTFVWGMTHLKINKQIDIIRVEDGFIRSVGLGSHLNNPINALLEFFFQTLSYFSFSSPFVNFFLFLLL